ncbi:hypothetical protein Tco_0152335 [Tanacetum coccineum]
MPRRSIWKVSFFDALLLRTKKKRDLLLNRKIGSHLLLFFRNSLIAPYESIMEKLMFVAEKAGQPLPYVPIASAARAPAPNSAGEASPDLRSANSVQIDFIQERRHP